MEGRRRITLYDQMTAGNGNTNSGSSSRDSLASLMLDDVIFKKADADADADAEASRNLSRSRTLQDIIREEKPNGDAKDRKSWKAFKEKLRLKRSIGLAWSSATTNSNNSTNNDNEDGNLPQTRLLSDDAATQQNDVVVEDANDSDQIAQLGSPADNTAAGGDSSDGENNQEVAVGVSLMDLLEEAEQELDLYRVSDDDVVAVFEKREEDEEKEGLVEYNCCVCMVRHKGAAFIPCGHTFCRMCCREIWASRGNCPLCNNLILEILDIF